MKRDIRIFLLASLIVVGFSIRTSAGTQNTIHDVVIYGGTSAGIAAAVQVRRMGGSVIILEPTSRIGGLTTGGPGPDRYRQQGSHRRHLTRVLSAYSQTLRTEFQLAVAETG